MARAAVQRRLTWLEARVLENRAESARVHRLVFDVPGWSGHLPGQHVDVRLTAEDGYSAQRSYSIASPPDVDELHLLVERLPDGEVSGYLTAELRPDDVIELRGPIGGYFVWSAAADRADPGEGRRPVQLVAGGTGVSPFTAMLDHRRRQGSSTAMQLLLSARTAADVLARELLGPETTVTLTRESPPGWTGETGRIDAAMLRRRALAPADRPRVFVCGPTTFAEAVATTLVDLGHEPRSIRIERFGNAGDT
ncbi:FAD-binding oxidoreductase [Blastococcus sp. SYSU D00669]